MPRGRRGFGRGLGWGYGWPGNPYPFCRWFPWLPRWWWAYPAYRLPYYGIPWRQPYSGYGYGAYASTYRYPFYMPY
ncbi:MAG: hypothetical protein U9O89_00870 [Thermoproteota archaeon]|nr:hypothetical protein [Thermoproteota archaeon]